MKLQKHFAYKYKNTEHYKYVIVIPEKIIARLGWKEGQKLEGKIENHTLILNSGRIE